MDVMSPSVRSRAMAAIPSKDTAPEIAVRKVAHSMGLRFRLHRRDLPGSPDIVFPRWGVVVFVHGCYWHRHDGCRFATCPATRPDFWAAKFRANVERDKRSTNELRRLGWRVGIVWECETRSPGMVECRLRAFGLRPERI